MEHNEMYDKAKKQVEARIGFYIHLAVYIAVNSFLFFINYATSQSYFWFKWPLFGWGIGLFFHGINIFVFSSGSKIKEQMIHKEMKKIEENSKK